MSFIDPSSSIPPPHFFYYFFHQDIGIPSSGNHRKEAVHIPKVRIHLRMKKGEGGGRSGIGRSMGNLKIASLGCTSAWQRSFFSFFPIFQVLNLPPSLSLSLLHSSLAF
jgi:hypothetical protein